MEPPEPLSFLLLAFALVLVNAFFVAAEFSLIAFRRPRADLQRPGDGQPVRVHASLGELNTLTLAAQVGRSVASLALGYIAVRMVAPAFALPPGGNPPLDPRLRHAAAVMVMAGVAVLHVVLGEQVPKLLALRGESGWVSRLTLGPLRVFALVLRPLLWLLDGLVGAVVRLFGVTPGGFAPLVPTAEEIRMLVTQGSEQGSVEEDEREMIRGVFEFSRTVAREVMTPRTDIVAVPVEVGVAELVATVTREGHSRLPVYQGTIDSVVGVVLAKDLLPLLGALLMGQREGFDVRRVMREPYFVPDTKPVDDLLAEFRQSSVHLAIVLDEFGGTYGLVTMEDLLEEIVGEINDEYDVVEQEFAATPEGDVLIDGGASISEVNERFGTALPEEDFDTIGGYIFGALGRVPVVGDTVPLERDGEAMQLRVEDTEERRVLSVRLARASALSEPLA